MAEYSSSSAEQVFFIYDHTVLKKEEDDLKDAIVYFHPASMPVDIQCGLCGQLMGMIRFFQDFSSAPKFYTLRHNKFAVFHVGKYSMALGGRRSDSDELLERQLDSLFSLFKFYHRSIDSVKQLNGVNGSRRTATSIHHIWDSYLAIIRHYGDVLATAFENIPWLEMPRGSPTIYMRASYLLQSCQKVKGVIAGCLFFKQRVVCTQLPTDITSRLLILKPHQSHLPCQIITPDCDVPDQVRILRIYLSKKEYHSLHHMKSSAATPNTSSDYSTSLEQSTTPSEHTSQEDSVANPRNRNESMLVIVDMNEDESISIHEALLDEAEAETSHFEQSQQINKTGLVAEDSCNLELVENHFSTKEKQSLLTTPDELSVFEPCYSPVRSEVCDKNTESHEQKAVEGDSSVKINDESTSVCHGVNQVGEDESNSSKTAVNVSDNSVKDHEDRECISDHDVQTEKVSVNGNHHMKGDEIVMIPDSKTQSDAVYNDTSTFTTNVMEDKLIPDADREFKWPVVETVPEENSIPVTCDRTSEADVNRNCSQCSGTCDCHETSTSKPKPSSLDSTPDVAGDSSSTVPLGGSSASHADEVRSRDPSEKCTLTSNSVTNDSLSSPDLKPEVNMSEPPPEDATNISDIPNGHAFVTTNSSKENDGKCDIICADIRRDIEITNDCDKDKLTKHTESQTAKLFQRVKSVATATTPEATLGNILKDFDKQSSCDTDDAESGIFNDDSSMYSLPRSASVGSRSSLRSWKENKPPRMSPSPSHGVVRRTQSHDTKWNRMNSTSPMEVMQQQMRAHSLQDGKELKKAPGSLGRLRSRTHDGYRSPRLAIRNQSRLMLNNVSHSQVVLSHDSGGPSSVNDMTTEVPSSPTPHDGEKGERNLKLKIRANYSKKLEGLTSPPMDLNLKKRSVSFIDPDHPDGKISTQPNISEEVPSQSGKHKKGRRNSRSSSRGSRSSSVGTDESDGLRSFDLYIQGNSDMLLLLLLEKDAGRNRDTVLGLCQWDMALCQLGDLDALLKQCADTDAFNQGEGDYYCLKFDKTRMNLNGNVLWPVTASENEFCETAIQMHEEFRKNPSLHDISLRTFSSSVFGQRTVTQETYIQSVSKNRYTSGHLNERERANMDLRTKQQVHKNHNVQIW